MPELALDAAAGPAVRGACPSGHRPFVAADGLLVRIRVPGGELGSAQAAALARVAGRDGNGVVELTSRANVQVRGVRDETLPRLQADLAGAGLLPADPGADERRNVLAAPAAGLDSTEVADVRPITRRLLARLLARLPDSLHPKAGVLLDGGGEVSVRGIRQDVALGAARHRDTGEVVAELALGAALPLAADPASLVHVVPLPAAAEVAAGALGLAAGRRVGEVVDEQGVDAVVDQVRARAGVTIERIPAGLLIRAVPRARPPIGLHHTRRDGVAFIGAAPVLGRLDAAALEQLARAAARYGDGTVRLTPWRSVLVPGVRADRAQALAAELAALRLATDPADPALSVVACVGSAGCSAGLADTLADARSLIEDLRRAGAAGEPVPSVHVSGCAKRCASRAPHDVTLVAVASGGYAS